MAGKKIEKKNKEELFFTLVGCRGELSEIIFEYDMALVLEKDSKNEYDHEAIKVSLDKVGQVGWVANSVHTKVGETFSAGRLYDKIEDKAYAKVKYLIGGKAICEIIDKEEYEKLKTKSLKHRNREIIYDDELAF